MAMLNEAAYTAASLLIVSELIREKTDLRFQLYSFDTITKTKRTKNDSDSDEEHFVDVDKDEKKQQQPEKNTKNSSDLYDPLKREPKWANAESSALFELIQLTYHTHPTVKLWATKLLEGEVINYNGDPLLDFGMANFLDRIAYKNPKSVEKIAKFSSGRRMAATEQPINLYDFSGNGGENDMPQNLREEEQYLYKYFKMRGPKATATKKKGADEESDDDADLSNKLDGSDLEGEDPEMEAFANEVIEKEMKKMTKQQDDLDDEVLSGLSDEDIDDEDGEDDMNDDDGEDMEDDLDEEDEDEGDFFDGEDGLQEVKVGEEDEDDSEMEMGADDDDEDDEEVQEYIDEEEDEEDDDIFDKKGNKGAKSKDNGKKKKEQKSIFADYDEFAHLLEGDMYDGG